FLARFVLQTDPDCLPLHIAIGHRLCPPPQVVEGKATLEHKDWKRNLCDQLVLVLNHSTFAIRLVLDLSRQALHASKTAARDSFDFEQEPKTAQRVLARHEPLLQPPKGFDGVPSRTRLIAEISWHQRRRSRWSSHISSS